MNAVGALWRQRVRRDRVQVPLWIVATALLAFSGYAGVTQSYGTVQDRAAVLAAALANPVILMFRGLPSGTSEGAFVAFEVLPWLAMLAALMSIFLAVRHTRGDEEAGCRELVAATPAGRAAPVVSTLVHGAAANVVLAALCALALASTGLPGRGSAVAAAAAGATGVVFLGIGLVAGQLMRTARGANTLAVWVLLATFLVRGTGNALGASQGSSHLRSSSLAWVSPFGWAEQTRPWDADSWWPIVLSAVVGLVLAGCAVAVQSARDLGGSVIAPRPGRVQARRALRSPQALVWRLSAGSLVGWAIGGALCGILATTLTGLVNQVTAGNRAVDALLSKLAGGVSVADAVVTVFFTMMGILAACAAVQTMVRARQEEARGTAEPVLAARVDRVRWLGGHLVVAMCAVVIVTGAGMLAGYLGIAAGNGPASLVRVVTVTGLGQMAAAAVFAVVAALVFVVAPHVTVGLSWALLVIATVLGMFGPLFGLPAWTAHTSPFGVTPVIASSGADVRGLWWLLAVIAVGAAASLTLMRRRELADG